MTELTTARAILEAAVEFKSHLENANAPINNRRTTMTDQQQHPLTGQITLEEALSLVSFKQNGDGSWGVRHVHGNVRGSVIGSVNGSVHGNVGINVHGNVYGNIDGRVSGSVSGSVIGSVLGHVHGNVVGTISGRKWKFVETPKEKLRRLIEEGADKEQLIEAFNQLEARDD